MSKLKDIFTGGVSRRSTTGKSPNGEAEASAHAVGITRAARGGRCKTGTTPQFTETNAAPAQKRARLGEPRTELPYGVAAWRDTRFTLEQQGDTTMKKEQVKETESQEIVPRALMIAAKTFTDKPRLVGECLIALVRGTTPAGLSDVQRYILQDCREELAERQERRAQAAERKRAQRARLAGATLND